jgi:hypothetical protein
VIAGRGLTIERMVELARVSRASFYRFSEEAKPDRDMDLRDAIQRIALEWPSYTSIFRTALRDSPNSLATAR